MKLPQIAAILFPAFLAAAPLPQFLATSFASAPLASPTGAKVAWLENEQGKRNVYVAAAPAWKAQRITDFQNDDGQEIAELAWAPDGSYLLFARGGDFETGGDNPNPNFDATTPAQEIWYAAADGSALKKVTEGHAPAISPRGGTVAFLRGGQIFTMTAVGDEVKNIVNQKGKLSSLSWSPDGATLAFVDSRADHSVVGAYTFATKTVKFFDASTDNDQEPAWSADGSRLAYLRIPSEPHRLGPGPRRDGPSWSVRVLDLKTGAAREVFRAQPGMGSVFRELGTATQLFWTDSDRLVFPWERTGWLHLYSVPAAGGTPLELTPGEGEVEDATLSADRKTICFNANIGDLDARHLWSVSPTGGAKQLTSGDRIDWAPSPVADNSALFFLASSYNEKAHPVVRLADGSLRTPMAVEALPGFVKPQSVIINAADGLKIHCQLFLPPDLKPGERRPALAFFHGGSRRQMLLGFHYMYYYSNAYAMNQFLASQGYVVLSVNYRSGIGYGLNFREALNYGAQGGSEYNDVMGAGLYLKSRGDVDANRVGLWGGSYGGYLTAMGLSRSSDLFAAGVDFHGVHDWSSWRETGRPPSGGDPKARHDYEEAQRVAFESSPMAYVDGWKSPVLLIHGDDDRNVSFEQTIVLAQALRERKVDFEELIFPNEIHDFLRHQDWLAAYQATADFFARKLK